MIKKLLALWKFLTTPKPESEIRSVDDIEWP